MSKKEIGYITAALVLVILSVGYLASNLSVNINVEPASLQTNFAAAGDTYSTAKVAAIGVTTASSTLATVCNTDARDRVVQSVFMTLNTPNSYGTSTNYLIVAATTTSGRSGVGTNTNYLLNQIAQASLPNDFIFSSTTPGLTATTTFTGAAATTRRWASGSCLNFVIASSTSVTSSINGGGTDLLLGSTTSGVAGVNYIAQ